MQKNYFVWGLAAFLLGLNACGEQGVAPKTASTGAPDAPATGISVGTITVGSAINSNGEVTQAADSFGRTDTIYAALDITGSGTTTVNVIWTRRAGGEIVTVRQETHKPSSNYHRRTSVESHLRPLTAGRSSSLREWPAGDYQVEFLVDGKSAGTKTFTVK